MIEKRSSGMVLYDLEAALDRSELQVFQQLQEQDLHDPACKRTSVDHPS